ncbi:MAG TPA: Crp/Fnr family transcriptional regulator [Pyrinomonadaceae bacterium]
MIAESCIGLTENKLLALLPDEERTRLLPFLEFAVLAHGKVIFEPDEPIQQVCFPLSGIISIVAPSESGASVEVVMVGAEGVTGIPALWGDGLSPNSRAVVQVDGTGMLIRADALRREFYRGGTLQELLLRYTQTYLTQITQSVLCQCFHHIEARLARWLLECRLRTNSNELRLTQEYIAQMIGVRRAGVSGAVAQLKERGLIEHTRGTVWIINQAGLEAASCECFQVIRAEVARLFGDAGQLVTNNA